MQADSGKEVRVRIAPAPTGYLHVGTARTALFNWLYARHHGGKFIVRIEDTDEVRSSPAMVDGIIESLRWLGLDWDEGPNIGGPFGPYRQSERREIYRTWADRLLDDGKAYVCFCSQEDLARMRERQGKKASYDRRCRDLPSDQAIGRRRSGEPSVIRFRTPLTGRTVVYDRVRGRTKFMNATLDDFVIMKWDGYPTYNFACVIDDALMKVTHVIRGDDHMPNAPKQCLLYDALGFNPPRFAHLPLIHGEDGSKLSKRHAAISVVVYRDRGYLSEALVNFLALLGWSPPHGEEIMAVNELISLFSLKRINKSAAKFDVKKLDWMNGKYINSISNEKLLEFILPLLEKEQIVDDSVAKKGREWLLDVIALMKPRVKRLTGFGDQGRYFFTEDFPYDAEAVKAHFSASGIVGRLGRLRNSLSKLTDFTEPCLEECVKTTAIALGLKPAMLIHPARVALTGLQATPGLYDVMKLLGKRTTLLRLERAIDYIKSDMGR